MLPGYTATTGYQLNQTSGDHGVTLAGGSSGGNVPPGCWVESAACFGIVEFCHVRCLDGSVSGMWRCGWCFGAWW